MAEPHITEVSEESPAEQRQNAQPLHLLAIGTGLAMILGAASNQAVALSSQILPHLPAPGIPALRVLVGTVGACVMAWGMWGLFGPAVMRVARLRRWRRSLAVDELPAQATAGVSAVKPRVDVRLRCDGPVQVDLHSTVPNVSIWFEVISHLNEDATLEKIAFQLWAGQPVLTATMDHRHNIPNHSTVSNVYFSGELTPGAVERIRQEMVKRAPRGKYMVQGTAYFTSASGRFEVYLIRQERDIPPTD